MRQRWAKSIVWSCGRPGWTPMFEQESWGEVRRLVWAREYARAMSTVGILRPDLPVFSGSAT
jgi:hypothetical protein